MPIHTIQPNFSGGEVSPHLYARVDAQAYGSWLKTGCNFLVHPQGGASNRPGTAHVNTAKYAAKNCRLIPFVLSSTEAYVLEFGHQYIRVHTQAGTMQQGGSIYELSSPYKEQEIDSVNFVQYENNLFLTHSSYPPKKLTRNANGYFTLQNLSIKDGPFIAANTDETKKVRLSSDSETVTSEGVKASLAIQPMSYPNYFIQAFWQGERFYDPSGTGFDVSGVVQAFNSRCGSTGCVAYNQGGILRIESPQATGGDWNGAELMIYYRSSIVAPPNLIVTQQLRGGTNAGTVISSGEATLYLESNVDLFRPGHEGALWSVNHHIESQYESGTLGYTDTSAVIKSGGDWGFRTMGEWYGEIVLESSEDQVTWKQVKHFTKGEDDENLNVLGDLATSVKMYYVRLRCLEITGEMGYVLQAASFNQEGIVRLDDYVSARKMKVTILRQPGDSSAWTYDWAEGAFSADAGYPRCVFFFQNRLGFAGSQREPQAIWFSKTAEYEDFGYQRDIADSDAISVHLSSKKLNTITSVAVGTKLLVFTTGSEWSLGSNGALTPYNMVISQEGERGSSLAAPLVVGNRTLYVQARGGVLRDFFYDYSGDCYTGRDLTLRAKHLFFNREIKELAYQQEPDNLVWCVLNDGTLLSLTYLAEQDVCAWMRHETQGKFISVCCIPSHGYDETWFLVERNNKRYIERLMPRMNSTAAEDQVFLDASVSKKQLTAFTEVTGLGHLEGKKVNVLADGNPIYGLTVSNSKVVLPRAVYTAHVGLSYQACLETLPVEFNLADGTVQDRKRRLVQVTLKVLNSRGGLVGAETDKLDELIYFPASAYGQAAALQTLDLTKMLSSVHGYFPTITVLQKDPLPLTVLAILTHVG